MNRTHARFSSLEGTPPSRRPGPLVRRGLASVALTAGVLASGPAMAQYVVAERPEPFVNLESIPNVGAITTHWTSFGSTLTRNQPIGFDFVWNNVTHVNYGVSAEGWIGLEPLTTTNSEPNNQVITDAHHIAFGVVLAAWWDDLNNNTARTAIVGTAPNRIRVIEFQNFRRQGLTTTETARMQVWLFEGSNHLEFRYGGQLTGTIYDATVGFSGPAGFPRAALRPCSITATCTHNDFNAMSNRAFLVLRSPNPELTGGFGTFPRGAVPGNDATGQVRLTNYGTVTATTVVNRVYLSLDNQLDAGDALVGSVTADIPNGDTLVPVTITVPPGTPDGDYFLILQVDATDRYPEFNENDNVVASTQLFATAYEFQPTAITVVNAAGVNPGDNINFNVTITNNGVPRVGSLELGFFASVDQIFDLNDTPLGVATVNMSGSNVEQAQASLTFPNMAPGNYFAVVRVNPNGSLPEANSTNNILVAATPFATGPDFAIGTITVPAGVQPGAQAQITTTIRSIAVPYTGSVSYRLFAARGQTRSPQDVQLGTFTVQLTGQSSLPDTRSVTFPTSLAAGRYYVIAVVDPNGQIPEVTETNNTGVSATTIANAVDFAIVNVTATPAQLEINQNITIGATARSLGLAFTGNVPYRVYLSNDDQFDLGDQPIYQGQVFFTGSGDQAINVTTPLRALPGDPQLVPGSYRIIVAIDPANAFAESDETNNWARTNANITIRGADLVAQLLTAPQVAFMGMNIEVRLTIANTGAAAARGFRYAYYLTPGQQVRLHHEQIFLSATATIAAGGTQQFVDQVAIPVGTSTRAMHLGVIVDPFYAVPETSKTNNTRATPNPLAIVFPIPNLTGQIVDTATAAAAGEQFAVTRLLINDGVAPAPQFRYTYYLSSNPTIATDDIAVGSFTGSLEIGENDYGIDTLLLPSSVPAGRYYVGMILDPEQQITEITRNDNAILGPQVEVFRAAIQFITDTLPRGTVGVPYEVGVYARGGPVGITWSVEEGALPTGLSIGQASGIISGTPTVEGLYNFTLRANSGTAFARRSYQVRVTAPTVDIRIATPSLPSGIAGRPYETRLVAVGGHVPYEWSASGLPQGLTLSADGLLSGTPQSPGNFGITFRVRDTLNNTASRELVLNAVNANQTLTISQVPLPAALVGVPYCEGGNAVRLEAQNGIAPYVWSMVGDAPEGMSLNAEGELCGTPAKVGRFPITVRVQDQTGMFNTSLLMLEVEDGRSLAIATFTLDGGQVGQAYSAGLSAIRGSEPYLWNAVEGWGRLPAGLALGEDGRITGTPSEAGTFAFVAQVTDAALRVDVQPLSIYVAPAPETTPGPMDEGCGCTAADDAGTKSPWTSLGLFAVLGGLLVARRRKSAKLGLGALVAVSALALPAQAQLIPGTPYQMSYSNITYQDLPNPTVLWSAVDDGVMPVTLPFPFRFYESEFTTVSVGANAALAFPGGTAISFVNGTPGSTAAPNGFIAPFWDDHQLHASAMGSIGYQVQGTEPNRTVTFEWKRIGFHGNANVQTNFQLRLFEGRSARIEMDYGPTSGTHNYTATMGMEDPAGGRPIFFHPSACVTTCSLADFQMFTNRRITVVQDPGVELIALGIRGPELAFLGAETPITVTVGNLHGAAIGPFTVAVEAARTRSFENAVTIGARVISMAPFQTQSFDVTSAFPHALGEGQAFIRLLVDSTNAVVEVNEQNNIIAAEDPVRLIRGRPDLAVQHVAVSARQVAAGGTLQVVSRIRNIGGEPADDVDVAVMLSTNPVISPQDVELDLFQISVAPGQTVTSTRTITVPANTNSGNYYFGVLADPRGTLDELSESNNGRPAGHTVAVAGGALAVLTDALPAGIVRVTYVGLLVAGGGPTSSYTWEITSGRLPQGLGLVPASGELFGRPVMPECQNFTARVTSGSETASKPLTLCVASPDEPLTIVSRAAPPAIVGQEYSFRLIATGGAGTSSLAWSASGLPNGIALSDDGVLMGTAVEVGSSTVAVQVGNGSATASRDILLDVRSNGSLLIQPKLLSTAYYGQRYSEQLEAVGGVAPIAWIRQLGRLPDGVTLSTTGELSGTPMQVGRFRFVVEARDAGGGAPARDVATYELVVADTEGFEIDTASLPDATIDEAYDQTISASGGQAPYEWALVEGRMPEGLQANVNPATGEFRIAGQPSELGTTNFLVRVRDAQSREALRAFAIRVVPKPVMVDPTEPTDEGCSCAAQREAPGSAAASLLLLGLAGLGLATRRRR